jgi:hypothetical protein
MPRTFHIVVLGLCLAIFAAAFLLDADDTGVYILGWKWPVKCAMYETFHVRCATCGMTRAFVYAAHGKWDSAWQMNVMWPAAAVMLLLEVPYRLVALARWPGKAARPVRIAHIAVIAAALTLVFGHWIIYLGGLLK